MSGPEETGPLPPLLAQIAEVIGEEGALVIARIHGGTRVTVPKRADGRNWLTETVGRDSAGKLIEVLGGGNRLDIPLGPQGTFHAQRRSFGRRLQRLIDEGKSGTEIARLLGVTDRTVRNRKRAQRNRGPDLFG